MLLERSRSRAIRQTAPAGETAARTRGRSTDSFSRVEPQTRRSEGLAISDMPGPVDRYATFRCIGVATMPTVTMAEEFVEAVLGTNPTRIETRLLRVNTNTEEPATTILVGHGMVGYTDIQ